MPPAHPPVRSLAWVATWKTKGVVPPVPGADADKRA